MTILQTKMCIRDRENSVLRSVGLAPKQLAQMAVWEGMGYVVSSILLMLAIGLPITLLVWRKFKMCIRDRCRCYGIDQTDQL